MTKDVRVYLAHILECVDKIERFTAEGRDGFLRDPMVQDAVIRNLEIMGEAAKRVDEAYRADHPEVPWRELSSLRDVLIPSIPCRTSDRALDRWPPAWRSWSRSLRARRHHGPTTTRRNAACDRWSGREA
jgi:uncharacterized protein with HEPN domain